MNTPTDNAWLDEVLTGLGAYKITTFDPTSEEYYAYYPELKRAKQAILTHIDTVCREARIEEIEHFKERVVESLITSSAYTGWSWKGIYTWHIDKFIKERLKELRGRK